MNTAARTEETYADKIAKLLRKAENPAISQEEAEVFIQGAQRLMTKYAISEAMIAAAREENGAVKEEIIRDEIIFKGGYAPALWDIGAAIAKANDIRCLITKLFGGEQVLIMNGFKSDIDRAKMLQTSVQIQATGAMTKWAREQDMTWMTASQRYMQRREFLFGFARGLKAQLNEAARAAKAEAKEEYVESGGTSDSMDLVLTGRKERLDGWMDETYGKSLRSVSRNYKRGGGNASMAGHEAGRKANVSSNAQVRGNSKQLPR
jgi:hypothetical protein